MNNVVNHISNNSNNVNGKQLKLVFCEIQKLKKTQFSTWRNKNTPN